MLLFRTPGSVPRNRGKSVANLECIVCGEFQARNAKASGRDVWFGMDDDDNGPSPARRERRGLDERHCCQRRAALQDREDIVTETVCASVDHQPDAHVETLILTAADDSWA